MATVPAGARPVLITGYMKDDGTGPYFVDAAGNLTQAFPKKLLTDSDGANARLRVDVGQTGFFAGREARTFKELNLAGGSTYVVKAVVPVNIILMELLLYLETGTVRLTTLAGGTEGGSFAEVLPVIPKNRMTDAPVYVPQVGLTAGGTVTGGTAIDIVRLSADGQGNSRISVGQHGDDARGVLPGTYFFKFESLAGTAAVGTFHAVWEERPPAA